jgi:hypothetical protein
MGYILFGGIGCSVPLALQADASPQRNGRRKSTTQQTQQQGAIMNKTFFAFFIESCLAIAFAMVGTGVLFFLLWKVGVLGTSQASLIIWGFQMAFSGAIYMVGVPVTRYMTNLTVRIYHYPSIFVGLCVSIFTASNLLRINALEFRSISICLIVPPLIVILALAKKTMENKRQGSRIPQTR